MFNIILKFSKVIGAAHILVIFVKDMGLNPPNAGPFFYKRP